MHAGGRSDVCGTQTNKGPMWEGAGGQQKAYPPHSTWNRNYTQFVPMNTWPVISGKL